MSWASRRDTPPAGRHRRAGSTGLSVLAVAVLLALIVAGAMFSPMLLGWPPPSDAGEAPRPSTMGTPTTTPAPTRTTPAPSRTPTPTPTRSVPRRTTPPINAITSFENEVLSLTNAERRTQGCPALRLDTRLRTAARRHSAEMARFGYFSHTGQDGSDPGERMRDAGYPTIGGWAENIARGYPDPDAVMDGWMNSPGHRANILNCSLRALGVGVVRSSGGRVYWTQDFGAR